MPAVAPVNAPTAAASAFAPVQRIQLFEFDAREGTAEVAHRVARTEGDGISATDFVKDELTLLEAGDGRIEPRRIDPLQQPLAILGGRESPDRPDARIAQRLVVEVDRILRRQHDPEPHRPGLLHHREERPLRGRLLGMRWQVTRHFVEKYERPQVFGARLTPRPGQDPRQQQGNEKLALRFLEMRQSKHGHRRLAVFSARRKKPLRIQRRPLAPDRKRRRGDDAVQRHGQLHAVIRGEELIHGKDADLLERRIDQPKDQALEVQTIAGTPRGLEDVTEHHVSRILHGVGPAPHQAEKTRNRVGHEIAQRLVVFEDRPRGRLQRGENVHRNARATPRGVHRQMHAVAEPPHVVFRKAGLRDALFPAGRDLGPGRPFHTTGQSRRAQSSETPNPDFRDRLWDRSQRSGRLF